MNDNTDTTPTRRSVLKATGAAVSATGVAGVAAASEQQLGRPERRRILHSDKVEKIYREVGKPTIRSAKKVQGEVKKAEAVLYRFKTDFGELRRITYDGTTVAQFLFATLHDEIDNLRGAPEQNKGDLSKSISGRQIPTSLREKYGKAFQVPSSIYTNDGSVEYVREATAREYTHLAAVTDIDQSNAVMGYNSGAGGFIVQETESEEMAPKVVTPQTEVDAPSEEPAFIGASVEDLDVTPLGCNEKACWECGFSAFAGVVGCGTVCFLTSPTIGGIVLCIGCAIGAGVKVGIDCYQCHHTCK